MNIMQLHTKIGLLCMNIGSMKINPLQDDLDTF